MKTFWIKSVIDCDVQKLFNFHTDSANIAYITPPNIEVELLNDESTSYEGKVVILKTKKFFITTYWEVKIEKLQEPYILVDTAIKSPFKHWRHQHIFTSCGEKSILEDRVEFELPFGVFGKLLEFLIYFDIQSMFEFRHKQTKKILEGKSNE